MAPYKSLLITIPLASLTLATFTNTTNTTTTTTSPSASSSAPSSSPSSSLSLPPSPSALAALSLPGGTASPALTLFMYADPTCLDDDSSTLVNVLPLSYNVSSPQYPFWAFVLTRNLTGTEALTFYSSSNVSGEACAEEVARLEAGDMIDGDGDGVEAGVCLPVGGATCYNLTMA